MGDVVVVPMVNEVYVWRHLFKKCGYTFLGEKKLPATFKCPYCGKLKDNKFVIVGQISVQHEVMEGFLVRWKHDTGGVHSWDGAGPTIPASCPVPKHLIPAPPNHIIDDELWFVEGCNKKYDQNFCPSQCGDIYNQNRCLIKPNP